MQDSVKLVYAERAFTMEVRLRLDGDLVSRVTVDTDLDADAMQGTMESADGKTRMVRIGDEVFVASDPKKQNAWLRIDLDKLSATSPLRASLDVNAQWGILAGLVSIDEQAGVLYGGTVDLKKAVDAATSASEKAALQRVADFAQNPSAVPLSADLDLAGRLVRMSYTVQTTEGEVYTSLTVTAPAKLSIKAPNPRSVTEATAAHYRLL
ncbi:hypothetical protein SAMN05421812_1107 [Asanoa hainanensis]|uniref:Lipoprotein LprG n=1 Tax=Asanoa hainanensis TaxID=560556 RepID=A0A239NP20_9ACTN|nr:hypothetical protein SAMN05421812_1107 [Asanoa hainanensis]